jgi:hypothetical protein
VVAVAAGYLGVAGHAEEQGHKGQSGSRMFCEYQRRVSAVARV